MKSIIGNNIQLSLFGESHGKCIGFTLNGLASGIEIDFDYIQDEQITRTSIRQCYQLNLNEIDYLHWYEYNELISGLTTESLLNKVRDIRTYDLSDVTDEKQRAKIMEAKERVALKDNRPKTEEEKELDKFWDKITG